MAKRKSMKKTQKDKPPLLILVMPLAFALLVMWLAWGGLTACHYQRNGLAGGITKIGILEGSYLLPQAPSFIYHGKVLAVLTAYTPRPEETDDTPHITASGQLVREGIVANNCYPFGTLIEINGKLYEVQDRMNKRFDNCCECFDILTFDLEKAREFGKKVEEIKIIR